MSTEKLPSAPAVVPGGGVRVHDPDLERRLDRVLLAHDPRHAVRRRRHHGDPREIRGGGGIVVDVGGAARVAARGRGRRGEQDQEEPSSAQRRQPSRERRFAR
jgi:hypothetical protein